MAFIKVAQLLLIGRGKQKLAREISSVLQYTTQFINLNNLVWQFHILQALRQLESEELNIVFVWQSNAHNRQNHIKWKFINHNQFFLLYSISLCQIGWFEYSSRKKKTFNNTTTSTWLNTNSTFKTKLSLTLWNCRKHRIQSIFQIRCVQSRADFFLSQLIYRTLSVFAHKKYTIFETTTEKKHFTLTSIDFSCL